MKGEIDLRSAEPKTNVLNLFLLILITTSSYTDWHKHLVEYTKRGAVCQGNKTIDDYRFEGRKSVWNHSNIMGVFRAFKSELANTIDQKEYGNVSV